MSLVDPAVFRARLIQAIGHENLYAWAAQSGVGVGVLQTIEKRGSIPKAETLAQIRDATGKSIDWLLGLDEINAPPSSDASSPRNEFVYIPRYDVKASGGTGHWIGDEATARFTMAFRRHWVENYLRADPKNLSVLRVTGDSMSPLFIEGDNILINHAQTDVRDGIYVIRLDSQVLVKRLQRMHSPHIRVISENPAYPPYEVPLNDIHDQRGFDIVGRVVWYGRQL